MTGEFGEALGTATEGAVLSRSLGQELIPPQGGKGHFHESECLNCQTPLIGSHCHQCGQAAHLHRTLTALGHDIAHGVFHLDGKLWRTIPMLAWKPGELTRRYVHGERVRYVSPMALFLFSIFIMVAVFQSIGLSAPTTITTRDSVRAKIAEARQQTEAELASDRQKLARRKATNEDVGSLPQQIAKDETNLAQLREAEKLDFGALTNVSTKADLTGIAFIDKNLIEKWRTDPGLMLYKLQSNSYKYSWMLIPLSVPFMWLLFFWRRDVKAYDHAIFVTYSIAFMSLFFLVISLAVHFGVSDSVVVPAALLLPAVHMYRQLKGAYSLSRFGALWRLCALGFFILLVIVLFLQFLLVLGAF